MSDPQRQESGRPRTSNSTAVAEAERVFRAEYPRLVAALARMTGNLETAEELAQDALVAALEQWPASGVPENAGAWLTAVGKRRAIDQFRRAATLQRKYAELGRDLREEGDAVPDPDLDRGIQEDIGDDQLRLVFTACHPVLSVPARVALTLRMVGGLTTAEIARAYLVGEPTIAQRIVRAKKTLTAAAVPFEVPGGKEFLDRLPSVLEVVYLIFNEGYSATASTSWHRPDLCREAVRLGQLLAGLVPAEPEVLGLLALMEIQHSRSEARVGPTGEPVLLLDQDRSSWDRAAIARGLAALERAEALAPVPGPYVLQAAIAACHARATAPQDTRWARIAELYAALAAVSPSPVVEVNRAVALAMAYGPRVGLELLDQLTALPALRNYHLLPSVRGDLLFKLGRFSEARTEFDAAAALTGNAREKQFLLARAQACVIGPPAG